MILFDIASIPSGLDIETWYDFYKNDVLLYDSEIGYVPFRVNDDKIKMIDISDMSDINFSTLQIALDKMRERRDNETNEARKIAQENSIKLVNYLKALNEGNDPAEILK